MQKRSNREAKDAGGESRAQARPSADGPLPIAIVVDATDHSDGTIDPQSPRSLVAFPLGDEVSDSTAFLTKQQARVVAWAPAPQVPAA